MRRLLFLWALAACVGRPSSEPGGAAVDRCANVACATGERCDPGDGRCRCGADEPCGAGEVCAEDRCARAPICRPGTRWAPGMLTFAERTSTVGLDRAGALGTRLAVGDIDGDGDADLFVRRGGNGADDFEGVRHSWLLENRDRRFIDVTRESGVRATRGDHGGRGRPGEVVAFADVDNDGDLDVFTGTTKGVDGALPGETSELMLNDGRGRFSFASLDSDLRNELEDDAVAGASFVDFDRDGLVDLWVARAAFTPAGTTGVSLLEDRLYRGDGAGGFRNRTREAGLETRPWSDLLALDEGRAHSRAWSGVACDLNGDGRPELMAASYGRAPNLLWQAVEEGGAVRFENRSVASGYAFDAAQDWRDNEFAKCYCATNRSAEGCAEVAPPRIRCAANWNHALDRRPFRLGGNSGTTVCADVDNDGHLDLFTTEITHWWAGANADRSQLLRNTGEAQVRFERLDPDAIGLQRNNPPANWDNGDMTAAVFDFDNDGWPDLYVGASDYASNHGLLFQQHAPGRFRELPVAEGIDHHRSHGIAVADFDRDGDLDVVLGHSRARCDMNAPDDCYATAQVRYFENLSPPGNWIQLELVGGPGTNRAAIGARVSVLAGGVRQTQEVGGGHGHYGIQHDRVLHFGLGAACDAEVTVRWPNRALAEQRFTVGGGARYRVIEGQAPAPIP